MSSMRLTKPEASVLIVAAASLLAGEWSETISEEEAESLRSAQIKLQLRNRKSGTRHDR